MSRTVAARPLESTHPPLALRNVVHGGRRSAVAIAGVAFAVTMVLLQLGFYRAVEITATHVYEQLDFDVVLLASTYDQFYAPGEFPRERLRQARALETVVAAAPLLAMFNLWRCPPYPPDDPAIAWDDERPEPGALRRWLLGDRLPRPVKRRELLLLGVDLDNNPFRGPIRRSIDAARPQLQQADRVLLDELSNLDFGWPLVGRYRAWELGRTAVQVVGGFPMLRGFAADGVAICNADHFARLCGRPADDRVQFGFLKLRRGDAATSAETCRALRALLPPDVVAYPRAEILRRESDHWVRQTSTGQLFAFGVLVATIVASAVVYQVLSNDVRDHLAEYATLKAMGYSNGYLGWVVVVQALLYAGAAYLIAGVLGVGLYRATEALAGIPMRLTAGILGLTLFVTALVGLVSAVFTLNKVWGANPADLF
jgi:putative ABC transport system permease protein